MPPAPLCFEISPSRFLFGSVTTQSVYDDPTAKHNEAILEKCWIAYIHQMPIHPTLVTGNQEIIMFTICYGASVLLFMICFRSAAQSPKRLGQSRAQYFLKHELTAASLCLKRHGAASKVFNYFNLYFYSLSIAGSHRCSPCNCSGHVNVRRRGSECILRDVLPPVAWRWAASKISIARQIR